MYKSKNPLLIPDTLVFELVVNNSHHHGIQNHKLSRLSITITDDTNYSLTVKVEGQNSWVSDNCLSQLLSGAQLCHQSAPGTTLPPRFFSRWWKENVPNIYTFYRVGTKTWHLNQLPDTAKWHPRSNLSVLPHPLLHPQQPSAAQCNFSKLSKMCSNSFKFNCRNFWKTESELTYIADALSWSFWESGK